MKCGRDSHESMSSRSSMYVNALLLWLPTAHDRAQSATGAPVTGTVFDSVAQLPLGGAVLQAARVDSTQRGAQGATARIFTAIDGATAGAYPSTRFARPG
jgi:hypothetical protein